MKNIKLITNIKEFKVGDLVVDKITNMYFGVVIDRFEKTLCKVEWFNPPPSHSFTAYYFTYSLNSICEI